MKKNIEWLKEEIGNMPYTRLKRVGMEGYVAINKSGVFELIDQLDDPEVLSQKWIDENKSLINGRSINPDGTEGECYDAHYIHVLELQNLLVPTLSEMETVEITEEPETVADVVSTFWKSYERLKEVMGMEVEELEE